MVVPAEDPQRQYKPIDVSKLCEPHNTVPAHHLSPYSSEEISSKIHASGFDPQINVVPAKGEQEIQLHHMPPPPRHSTSERELILRKHKSAGR